MLDLFSYETNRSTLNNSNKALHAQLYWLQMYLPSNLWGSEIDSNLVHLCFGMNGEKKKKKKWNPKDPSNVTVSMWVFKIEWNSQRYKWRRLRVCLALDMPHKSLDKLYEWFLALLCDLWPRCGGFGLGGWQKSTGGGWRWSSAEKPVQCWQQCALGTQMGGINKSHVWANIILYFSCIHQN